MTNVDIEKISTLLRHVAKTEILPRFKNLSSADIREKDGPGDVVTIADEASEKILTAELLKTLPGSVVVGEEAVAADAAVLQKMQGDAPVWVIDPLDGTYNFAHGIPNFGIILSLVVKGITQYGWIYDAPADRMALAVKGKGAAVDGKTSHVRPVAARVEDMTAVGGDSKIRTMQEMKNLVKTTSVINSTFREFLAFSSGAADFLVHCKRLSPWDHAAPVLFLEEADGYIALAENGKAVPYHPSMYRPCEVFAVAHQPQWQQIADIFLPLRRQLAG